MAEKGGFPQASGCYSATNGELEEDGETDGRMKLQDLMERLRHRVAQRRSWADTAKALRTSIIDKRVTVESWDKSVIQKQLESLQKAVKVTSLPLMLDRLETMARRSDLKFSRTSNDCYRIAGDFFWIEIHVHNMSIVKDVRISHHGEPVTCPELVSALNKGDYKEFQQHLDGLVSVYRIAADKKQKSKIFSGLQAVEEDLSMVAQLQNTIRGVGNYIHKSPLGYLEPRNGGQPMKMTYFVSPYDLLCEKTKSPHPMTLEAIIENQLGHSVTVGVESSSPHKLQSIPLVTVKTADGKSLPSFSSLTNANSHTLPACFMLRLQNPIPVSLSILEKIKTTTEMEVCNTGAAVPLLQLISQQARKGKHENHRDKNLHVRLPDQQHCYFVTCPNSSKDFRAVMVSKIPFTHPTSVPTILQLLRQQLLFNTMLASCIRSKSSIDVDSSVIFEVIPLNLQTISVTFEHPYKDTMATAEFDLTDITNVKCHIGCVSGSDEETQICSDDYACKILQRCLSIPVTLRSALKCVTDQLDQLLLPPPPVTPIETPTGMSKIGQERRQAFIEQRYMGAPRMDQQGREPVYAPTSQQSPVANPGYPEMAAAGYNLDAYSPELIDNPLLTADMLEAMKTENKVSKNPMLASLLDQETRSPEIHNAPMLSALLGDQAQSTPNPMAQPQKQNRKRKRRQSDALSPGSAGKSPKTPMLDNDFSRMYSTGSSAMDSDTSPANSAVTTPTSLSGALQDNPLISESHVSRLASSLDNIIKQEAKGTSTVQQSELASILGDLEKDVMKKDTNINKDIKENKYSSTSLAKLGTASTLEDLLSTDGASPKGASTSQPNAASSLATKQPNVETTVKPLGTEENLFGEPVESELMNTENKNIVDNLIKSLDNSGEDNLDADVPMMQHSPISSPESVHNVEKPAPSNLVFKVEDKIKEKKKKDIKDDKDRDKPPIMVTLRTKDATTFVSETFKEKSESKNSKITKEIKHVKNSTTPSDDPYDMPSDDEKFPEWHPRLPSLGIKEKRKKRHFDGESTKRKKEDGRREGGKKRKKTFSDMGSDSGDSEDKSKVPNYKPSTTIKITTVGGKCQIQNLHKSVPVSPGSSSNSAKNSSSRTSINSESSKSSIRPNSQLKVTSIEKSEKTGSPHATHSKLGKSGTRGNRSKSASGSLSSSKMDSKLSQTPQIKLKPVAVTSSLSVSSSKQSTSTSPVNAPSKPSLPQTVPSSSSKQPKAAARSRKGSLSAVIDKLKQNQGPTSGPLAPSVPPRKEKEAEKKENFLNKIDPTASKRDQMEMIRKQIINEASKPSTPTKELLGIIPKAPQGGMPSFKKIDPSKLAAEPKNESKRQDSAKTTSASNGSKQGGSVSVIKTSVTSGKSNVTSPSVKSNATVNQTSTVHNSKSSKSAVTGTSPKGSSYNTSPGRTPPHNSFGGRGGPHPFHGGRGGGPPMGQRPSHSVNTHESTRTESSKSNQLYGNKDSRDFTKSYGPSKAGHSGREPVRPEPPNKLELEQGKRDREPSAKETQGNGKSKESSDKDCDRKFSKADDLASRHFTDIVKTVVKLSDKPESESRAPRTSLEDHFEDISDDGIASPDEMPEPTQLTSETKSIPLTQDQSHAIKQAEAAAEKMLVNSGSVSEEPAVGNSEHCDNLVVHEKVTSAQGSISRHVENDTAFNSSENKENKHSEDVVFKAPTPKPSRTSDQERTRSDKSRSVSSPHSDVSSPEDRLVIDSPGTPKPVRSPASRRPDRSPLNPSPVQESVDSVLSPTGKYQETHSPNKSPATRNTSSPFQSSLTKSPGSAKSSYDIDDDLMNDALIL